MAPVLNMSSPICLVENNHGKNLCVNQEAKQILENLSQPLVVVSIVGPYRSGKSYLMNSLAGRKEGGFPLGHTVEAKTKGIWMLCIPHPKKKDHTLVLLDTEGLGDVKKGNKKNDSAILALTMLLSSTLVYNSRGTINNDAIEKLYSTIELCECITSKASNSPEAKEDMSDGSTIPLFVWTVRDFSLRVELQGRPVSEDEYLENSLQNITPVKSPKTEKINGMRETIRKNFPKRRCFLFTCPTNDSSLQEKMEQMSENELQPDFTEKIRSFCQLIYEKAEAKALSGGQVITGHILGQLLDAYTRTAVSGQISILLDSISNLNLEQNKSAVESARKVYEETMRSNHIETEQAFHELHEISLGKALKHFKEKSVNIKMDTGESKELHEIIKNQRDGIWRTLEASSIKKCQDLTQRLSKSLNKAVEEKKYHVPGGHKKFVTDKERLIEEYKQASEKGVKAEDVLQEILKSLAPVEQIILQCDQAEPEKPTKPKVTDRSDFFELVKYIKEYELDSKCYQRILIQLFGFSGHGKSSFVNSCMYVAGNEEFKDHAGESQSFGGKTMHRKSYKLTDSITIVDNRGFGTMNSSEAWEVYAQLCNVMPLNQSVTWKSEKEMMQKIIEREENDLDLIVPVFVYSSEQSLSGKDTEAIKEFLKNAQKLTKFLPFIILTKKLNGNVEDVKQKFSRLGMENIYTVENYILSDTIATPGKHMDIATFLVEVLETVAYLTQGSVISEELQKRERKEFQKKFLVEMAFKK